MVLLFSIEYMPCVFIVRYAIVVFALLFLAMLASDYFQQHFLAHPRLFTLFFFEIMAVLTLLSRILFVRSFV